MEGPNIIYRVARRAPSRHLQRGVLPPGIRPFEERPVLCPRLDDGVSHTRHLGGERRHRLAATVGIVRVPGGVPSELIAEAVVALTRGNLGSHPEGAAQTRVAVLGQLGAATKRARLTRCEIETAELQELSMMVEATQITGLGQDGQRVDRTNARNVAQQLIIDMFGQPVMGKPLYLVTLLDEAASLRDDHAEHSNCCRLLRDRQSHRSAGRFVYVIDKTGLGNLAANERPGSCRECPSVERGDAGRSGEPLDEREEPVGSAVACEAGDLGEVQRQVVGQDPVPGLRLHPGDRLVSLRELLQVIDARGERIDVALRRTDPQHVQDDLRVLGVVLVPAIVQRLARSCERDRRDEAQLEPCRQQPMCQRTMVITRRLEPNDDTAPMAASCSAKPS